MKATDSSRLTVSLTSHTCMAPHFQLALHVRCFCASAMPTEHVKAPAFRSRRFDMFYIFQRAQRRLPNQSRNSRRR